MKTVNGSTLQLSLAGDEDLAWNMGEEKHLSKSRGKTLFHKRSTDTPLAPPNLLQHHTKGQETWDGGYLGVRQFRVPLLCAA
jgi:hypothetical protein